MAGPAPGRRSPICGCLGHPVDTFTDYLAREGVAVSASMDTFTDYLAREGVEVGDRAALLDDLERLSRSYALAALERLGWRRVSQSSAPRWISAR